MVVFELTLLSRRVETGVRTLQHHGQTVFQVLGTKVESWVVCGLWSLEGHVRNKRECVLERERLQIPVRV